MMALILFETLLECLQSSYSLPGGILTGKEGLHYGDVHYMPMCHTLLMQCIPFSYFTNMVGNHAFQPANDKTKDARNMAAILLVYITDAELMCIEYIHIAFIIHHEGSQIYEPKSIPNYIQYIIDHIKYTRQK